VILVRVRDDQPVDRELVTVQQKGCPADIEKSTWRALVRAEETQVDLERLTYPQLQRAQPKPKPMEPQDDYDTGGEAQQRLDEPHDHGITVHVRQHSPGGPTIISGSCFVASGSYTPEKRVILDSDRRGQMCPVTDHYRMQTVACLTDKFCEWRLSRLKSGPSGLLDSASGFAHSGR
jgi:hypothetical protein